MRQIAIMVPTFAVLFSASPATSQGFQYGAKRGSWDRQFDRRGAFPCYHWSSRSSRTRYHLEGYGPQKPVVDIGDLNWDDKRRPRCIGLWDTQR